MKIMKKTAIAAVVALSASMTTYAEKVNIGDPGWTGATAIANLLSAVITEKMGGEVDLVPGNNTACLLYTSPSPRDRSLSRMPSSA